MEQGDTGVKQSHRIATRHVRSIMLHMCFHLLCFVQLDHSERPHDRTRNGSAEQRHLQSVEVGGTTRLGGVSVGVVTGDGVTELLGLGNAKKCG
jgi:hypothetical protein